VEIQNSSNKQFAKKNDNFFTVWPENRFVGKASQKNKENKAKRSILHTRITIDM
jgi:hypothetical protein